MSRRIFKFLQWMAWFTTETGIFLFQWLMILALPLIVVFAVREFPDFWSMFWATALLLPIAAVLKLMIESQYKEIELEEELFS